MLEVKNTLTEIQNAFDGLINRWDMAKETISVLKDMTVSISKTEKQTNKQKNQTIQDLWDNYKRGINA